MKQIKYLLVICVLCLACSNSTIPEKPKNLVSKNRMVDVMIDLSIVSSAKGMNKKIIEQHGITPDEFIYKRHEIDSVQFIESNAYYSYFMDDYKLILKRVEDSLEKLKFKYNRLAEIEEKRDETEKTEKKSKADNTRINKKRDSLIKAPILVE